MTRVLPLLSIALLLLGWEAAVHFYQIKPFVLPAPSAIFDSFVADWQMLLEAAGITLLITLQALLLALGSGLLLAISFSFFPRFEHAVFPLAVVLQVTPVVSIAPLIIIWVGLDHIDRAVLLIAWIVAFFPILANLTAGLKAVDPILDDVFALYKATKWQRFWHLALPTALPYLFASLKISAGLALIGAVVAEFVAGSGSASGLAWRILEAGNRLQIAKMMAALLLLSMLGMMIFYGFQALENRALRYRGR